MSELKFIGDENVGKLVRWLRMMGYDTLFFTGADDGRMVATALTDGRIILTRDTKVLLRSAVTRGRVRALLIDSDDPREQIKQLARTLDLDCSARAFSLCLVCNEPLEQRTKEEVQDRVPPYVFRTQEHYSECPKCRRVYWQGTHYQAMARDLREVCRLY